MRKRNCKYRGVKLCSCNGMELIRYAFVACLVALVASCKHTSPKEMPENPNRVICCTKYSHFEEGCALNSEASTMPKTKQTKIKQTQWEIIRN